jgi:hypothetical protein
MPSGLISMLAGRRPAIDGAATRIRDRASRTSGSGGGTVDLPLAHGKHEMQVTGLAGAADHRRCPMHAPADNLTPPQPLLMRVLVRSWDYRHPRAWAGVRFACGAWNLFLGVLLLASSHWLGPLAWLGAVPLVGAVLLFWTGYRLQRIVQAS